MEAPYIIMAQVANMPDTPRQKDGTNMLFRMIDKLYHKITRTTHKDKAAAYFPAGLLVEDKAKPKADTLPRQNASGCGW